MSGFLMLTLAEDFNFSSSFYQIKQTRYVLVPHANAAMTSRLTDQVFFISAMDVDKTFASVLVVGLDAIQPKNAGGDEVAFFFPIRRIGDRHAAAKNGVHRFVASDFLINPKTAERRLKAPGRLTQAEARARNWKLMDHPLVVEKLQSLFFCIDPDLVAAHFLSKVLGR
jgi:hypothetical protein